MGIAERKERERERRRQQIIVAAKRVFASKGFSKATMEDIANEAELSPGTLYLYFKNKDELYSSLSLRILHYLLIRVEHLKAELQQGSGKRIPALKQMMLDVYEFDPTILINMFHLQSSEILNNLSDELVEDIKRLTQRALESIGLILSDGIRSGEFIDLPPQTLADIIWSLFIGVVLWEESKKIVNEENDFLKPTLETAFEIFARGIRREPQHVEHAGRKEDSAKIAPGKVRQRKHQTAS